MKYPKIIPVLFAVTFLLSNALVDFASAKGQGEGSHKSHSSYRSSSSHRGSGALHRSSYRSHHSSYSLKPSSISHHSTYANAARGNHGKIKRSEKAKHDFQRHNPCPSTGKSTGSCPGYVIDHVKPLKRGTADSSSNMQWQTKAAAKAKDKWE